MHVSNVYDAAARLGVEVPRLFGLSQEYYEEFHSHDFLINSYNKFYWDGIIPDFVENFVIDILAGRVTR